MSHRVLRVAICFAAVLLALQAWRSWVLLASYDQGIFQQVLWNSLQGHPFESTLSSQLSTDVIHAGELPSVDYERLGQHFTPTLLLWAPLLGLIGGTTLPLVQVGLITAAGLTLHRLALGLLPERTANWLTYGFFAGNALIGPTLGNYTDLCQLPLAVFVLMLGLLERRRGWIIGAALWIPWIREDTGVLLVAVGLWLLLRQRQRWPLAMALIAWGGGWVLISTNLLMPLFSDDNAKRFMVENFGQYLGDENSSSSLGMVGRALRQPLLLLQQLVDPPVNPAVSARPRPAVSVHPPSQPRHLAAGGPESARAVSGPGSQRPALDHHPLHAAGGAGLRPGALFWWQRRPNPRSDRQHAWSGRCPLPVSAADVSSNPHRSLSFLIPDSVDPWVHSAPGASGNTAPPLATLERHPRRCQRGRQHPSGAAARQTGGAGALSLRHGLPGSIRTPSGGGLDRRGSSAT